MLTDSAITHLPRPLSILKMALVFTFVMIYSIASLGQTLSGRWSEEKANEWYAQQPWLVGSDYIHVGCDQ